MERENSNYFYFFFIPIRRTDAIGLTVQQFHLKDYFVEVFLIPGKRFI